MIKFSLEEDARSEVYNMVDEAMEQAVEETKKLFQQLGEICVKYQYKRFYDLTNDVHSYYIGSFKKMVHDQVENWINGDTSLVAAAKEIEAADDDSDESVPVAQELQTKILTSIDDHMGTQIDLPSGSTVVKVTDDLEEIFAKIDTVISKYVDMIDSARDRVDKIVDDNADQNQLYENAGEVIVPILEDYRSLFEKFEEGAEKLGLHLTGAATKAREKATTTKDTLVQEATTKGGLGFEEVSNLFRIG